MATLRTYLLMNNIISLYICLPPLRHFSCKHKLIRTEWKWAVSTQRDTSTAGGRMWILGSGVSDTYTAQIPSGVATTKVLKKLPKNIDFKPNYQK